MTFNYDQYFLIDFLKLHLLQISLSYLAEKTFTSEYVSTLNKYSLLLFLFELFIQFQNSVYILLILN